MIAAVPLENAFSELGEQSRARPSMTNSEIPVRHRKELPGVQSNLGRKPPLHDQSHQETDPYLKPIALPQKLSLTPPSVASRHEDIPKVLHAARVTDAGETDQIQKLNDRLTMLEKKFDQRQQNLWLTAIGIVVLVVSLFAFVIYKR